MIVESATQDRRRAFIMSFAGLASIALSILLLDRPVATLVHMLQRPAWAVWLTYIADVPNTACVLGLAVAGAAWLCGWRPGRAGRILIAVCLATLAATEAKDVLKFSFGRTWPETWTNKNPSWITNHVFGFFPFHGGNGWASFPSGHTTAITAPCAVLWRCVPRLRPVWAALPVLVVAGLVGSDFHFVSDCVAGALLAIGIANATVGYVAERAASSP